MKRPRSSPSKSKPAIKPPTKQAKAARKTSKKNTMDLQTKITNFGNLAMELRGKPEFQRISLYVQEKVGKRLQEFLSGPAPESEKHELIDELTRIVTEKDWDKLPAAPNGQTEAPTPEGEKPAAKPKADTAKKDEVVDEVVEDEDPEVIALQLQLAKAKAAKVAKDKAAAEAAAKPGITKDEIEAIVKAAVRAELKSILQGLVDAL